MRNDPSAHDHCNRGRIGPLRGAIQNGRVQRDADARSGGLETVIGSQNALIFDVPASVS